MNQETGLPNPEDDLVGYNREAWNALVRNRNQWTKAVTPEDIALARTGDIKIVMTPHKHVPAEWFPDFRSKDVELLCLAGSGGQQAPILAAAGAKVTVFDLSPEQLAQDRMVAEREGLDIKTVQGDMQDLSAFADNQFDLIVHPCSNCFVPDVNPVWREAARVLKSGGEIISGFTKPIFYLFDYDEMVAGNLKVAHKIPYSDLTSISAEKRQKFIDQDEPLCFGHSLTDQIGGQIAAGLAINGYYEDTWDEYVLSNYTMPYAVTKSRKS
ncbi:MAG: class I SAM-dependent methyltransferase [Mariniblastus sp.]